MIAIIRWHKIHTFRRISEKENVFWRLLDLACNVSVAVRVDLTADQNVKVIVDQLKGN